MSNPRISKHEQWCYGSWQDQVGYTKGLNRRYLRKEWRGRDPVMTNEKLEEIRQYIESVHRGY